MRHSTGCMRFWTVAVLVLLTFSCPAAQADIWQWLYDEYLGEGYWIEGGVRCPGGAGVYAVPGADLAGRDLTQAYLIGRDLTGANLASTNLNSAAIMNAKLAAANLSGANLSYAKLNNTTLVNTNLSNADLSFATLTGADFTGATIAGVKLRTSVVYGGLTKEQLYSTATYASGNLSGIDLQSNNLSGWNLAGKNLSNVSFSLATLTNANLANATLSNASFSSATLAGASLASANLSNANFSSATLTGANFAGATITGVKLDSTTAKGFTKEQLYSTATYAGGNLSGMDLQSNNFTGWSFAGKNLTGTKLYATTLTGANLTGATVAGVDFQLTGLSREQLLSTASYAARDLHSVYLTSIDLSGQNFAGMNLSGVRFHSADLENANFSGANVSSLQLTSTDARGAQGLPATGVTFSNTIKPNGSLNALVVNWNSTFVIRNHDSVPVRFEYSALLGPGQGSTSGGKLQFVFDGKPWHAPATFASGMAPDFDSGALEVAWAPSASLIGWIDLPLFDWGAVPFGSRQFKDILLNAPANVTLDYSHLSSDGWVRLTSTAALPHAGDANGDGAVDVGDLGILGANYGKTRGTGWMLGDFTGDGRVDVGDLGVLGVSYGYRAPAGAVPEPATLSLLAVGGLLLARRRAGGLAGTV